MPASRLFTLEASASALGWLAAVLYLLGLVTLVLRRRRGRGREPSRLDHLPVGVGLLAHTASIVLRAQQLGRFPVGNLPESAAFLALLLGIAYLVAAARFRFPAVGALLLASMVLFLALSFLAGPAGEPSPELGSQWFVFHTLLSFLGTTALLAVCILSALYLLADGQLKHKRPGPLLRFLPSLVACDRASLSLLAFGFPLLTLGILFGWMWSRESGRLDWGPKEVWALTAWAIYAVLLAARLGAGWHGRRAAILGITGAVAVLGAVLGIRP